MAKFCSGKCRYRFCKKNGSFEKGKKNYSKIRCYVCNKEFYKLKSIIKRNPRNIKYWCCSKKCRGKLPIILFKGIKTKDNLYKFKCKNCGKEFYKEWYRYGKFCNHKCYYEFRKKQYVKIICKNCGNGNIVKAHKKDKQKFCNEICQKIYLKKQAIIRLSKKINKWRKEIKVLENESRRNRS